MPERRPLVTKALVLLNLGTPDSPEPPDVRRYLAEFLMDPFVVDIPWVARAALVYGIVLPVRPRKSSAAYKKIWGPRGSPLLFHLEDLCAKVSALLPDHLVLGAMRYQSPSIRSALETCKSAGIREITVFPLYPQYSLAATESSIAKVRGEAGKIGLSASLRFIPPFYDSPAFIRAFARTARETLRDFEADHVLFSFHGLPERQVRKAGSDRDYRVQSFATAHAIAQELGFAREQFGPRYGISFQSRLGRTPWIRPYTDLVLPELAQAGARKIAVVCPSFVADCLETLEEIAIRGRTQFRSAGGTELRLVPSLNSSDDWARAVIELAGGSARPERSFAEENMKEESHHGT